MPGGPNKANKYTLGENPKLLSEMASWDPHDEAKGKLKKMLCYPFVKIKNNPQAKGPRVESLVSEVCPGMPMRITFWADGARGGKPSAKGKAIECEYAGDYIPAFALVRVQLSIKVCADVYSLHKPCACAHDTHTHTHTHTLQGCSASEDVNAAAASQGPLDGNSESADAEEPESAVKKGYGLGIAKVTVVEGASLYSALEQLPIIFPSTSEKSVAVQKEAQEKFKAIQNVIQAEQAAFWVRAVNKDAQACAQFSLLLKSCDVPCDSFTEHKLHTGLHRRVVMSLVNALN